MNYFWNQSILLGDLCCKHSVLNIVTFVNWKVTKDHFSSSWMYLNFWSNWSVGPLLARKAAVISAVYGPLLSVCARNHALNVPG